MLRALLWCALLLSRLMLWSARSVWFADVVCCGAAGCEAMRTAVGMIMVMLMLKRPS